MEKYEWITWLAFLQSSECLPENEDEMELASNGTMGITDVQWESQDKN